MMFKNWLSFASSKSKTRGQTQTTKMEQAYKLATKTLQGRLIAPYQREGVMWLLWRELSESGPRGGFLCDEMGLGKTVQLIATLLGNPRNKTLVIVPKSIVNQWVEEIDHFAPHLKVKVHEGGNRTNNPESFEGFDVVIAPYSVLTNKSRDSRVARSDTVLHKMVWDRVILDEGHEIRNPRSKLSISIRLLQSHIRWVVSGTPVYNSVRDFVTLCEFLGIKKSLVLGFNRKIQDTYVIRRTKEDVAAYNKRLTLPPCDFQNVELEMYKEEESLYMDVFRESQGKVKTAMKTAEHAGMRTMAMLECLLRCRQAMIHPQLYMSGIARKDGEDPEEWQSPCRKTEYLLEAVLSHPKEKSLVFSQFVEEMNIYEELFLENEVEVYRIDGSVSKDERVEALRQFKKSSNHCVFLIQIKAGGQGLNIQEATRVYITSPSWNPATELQAIARSHRTGQTRKVIVRKLMYGGSEEVPSVEHSIMNLQGHKAAVSAQVLNDDRLIKVIPTRVKKGITVRDLRKIFQV